MYFTDRHHTEYMKKLVIIPAYNEQGSILKTVADIQNNAPGFDYIVINDCSLDDTEKICQQNGIQYVSLPVNLGIGGGVQTGYMYALAQGYDVAVQFDGDGQHNAAYLQEMFEELVKNDASMVIGSRFITNQGFQSSLMRRIGIKWFNVMIRLLTGQNITDPTSGMRMVSRDVIEIFAEDYPRDYPEPESVVQIIKKKKRVLEVPVVMNERTTGESSISAGKSVYYMIKVTLAMLIASARR